MSRPEGPAADRPDSPVDAGPPQPAADEREGPSTAEREELYAGEHEALRLQRANRATRGGLAALLCLEAFVVLLVPRGIAQTEEGVSTTKTLLLVGLAVVLVGCAFLLGRRWGIALGSVLQLALAATIVLIPALAVVVVIFLLLWLYLLRTRRTWLGTRRGWRMLVS
jgi:hypothetical protein